MYFKLTRGPGGPVSPGLPVGGGSGVVVTTSISSYAGMNFLGHAMVSPSMVALSASISAQINTHRYSILRKHFI